MGGMEFNKIFAALLVAGIVAMFGGFLANVLVHPHKLEQDAYNVEALDDSAGGGVAAVAMAEPILALIADADAARGEKIAKACAACHTFNKGGANGVGPNLYGVIGGPKDHIPGFSYSGALLEVGGKTWTYAELNKFLWKPKTYAPGTKMSYAGLKKPEDRAALLAWLRAQSDSPVALPSDGEIAAEKTELAPPVADTPAANDGEAATPPATDMPAASAPAAETKKSEPTAETAPAGDAVKPATPVAH